MIIKALPIIAAVLLMAHMARGQHAATKDSQNIHAKYKVWTIAPIHLFESGLGTSVSYERGIDASGVVTYIVQAMGTTDLTRRYASMKPTGDPMFIFMPGLKFYPTTCFGHTKYSVGPSLVIGAGQKSDYDTFYPAHRVGPRFLLGMMVNNSINYQFGNHMYLGLDYGLGFSYVDRANGVNTGTDLINQIAFRMGYRL